LELLTVEIDTIWARDERGRLVPRELADGPAPYLVIATADDAETIALGQDVPDEVASRIQQVVTGSWARDDWASEPEGLARCRELLEAAVGPVRSASGPSYLVPSGLSFAFSTTILRSDRHRPSVRPPNPVEAGWEEEEWLQLLDGVFGPWAMALEEGDVVSVCHCARLTDLAAEAGVRTDPRYRGRGFAAAVTAAWGAQVNAGGRHAFYSTSAANISSQRVAGRLDLPLIGWLWSLLPAG
jgi:hypothetical protein